MLIVEDDRDLSYLFAYTLAAGGYEVLSVHDGRSGLQAAEAFQPDALLLDRTLPDMDGREVCRLLRKRHIPILFMTGRRDETKCGFCAPCEGDTLIKPASAKIIIARLEMLISRPPS